MLVQFNLRVEFLSALTLEFVQLLHGRYKVIRFYALLRRHLIPKGVLLGLLRPFDAREPMFLLLADLLCFADFLAVVVLASATSVVLAPNYALYVHH